MGNPWGCHGPSDRFHRGLETEGWDHSGLPDLVQSVVMFHVEREGCLGSVASGGVACAGFAMGRDLVQVWMTCQAPLSHLPSTGTWHSPLNTRSGTPPLGSLGTPSPSSLPYSPLTALRLPWHTNSSCSLLSPTLYPIPIPGTLVPNPGAGFPVAGVYPCAVFSALYCRRFGCRFGFVCAGVPGLRDSGATGAA